MKRQGMPTFASIAQSRSVDCRAPDSVRAYSPLAAHSAVTFALDDRPTLDIYTDIELDNEWSPYLDVWTPGRVSRALQSAGGSDVIVNLSCAGGNSFGGLGIYNMLRSYPGDVEVRLVALAASAASIIAMAGDKITVLRGSALMMHNAWAPVSGDRHALMRIAADLEPLDRAVAEIYAARSGKSVDEIAALMDAQTWFYGENIVESGFADDFADESPAYDVDLSEISSIIQSMKGV